MVFIPQGEPPCFVTSGIGSLKNTGVPEVRSDTFNTLMDSSSRPEAITLSGFAGNNAKQILMRREALSSASQKYLTKILERLKASLCRQWRNKIQISSHLNIPRKVM